MAESGKVAFKHDFSGSCVPGGSGNYGQSTFSVGIFQWLPKSGGKGLKKSAVIIRVKGYVSKPEAVYARASEFCGKLDAGWAPDKKSFSV